MFFENMENKTEKVVTSVTHILEPTDKFLNMTYQFSEKLYDGL